MRPPARTSASLALFAIGCSVALALAGTGAARAATNQDDFLRGWNDWKTWRYGRLTAPDSWLTLVGLYWLKDGSNEVGSAAGSTVPLPTGRAPARLGTITVDHGRLSFTAGPAVSDLTAGGKPVAGTIPLVSDANGDPTVLAIGSVSFYVIERADKYLVRVKDSEAKLRKEFPGLEYFPPDPKWRLDASFEPNPPGTKIRVPNELGQMDEMPSPGHVRFTVEGKSYDIVGLDDTGDGKVFLVFADRTNGRETYGGGRFLYTDPPKDGKVIVDFNRSYNPPCAFTPFATCPLPLPSNRLPFRIDAGEKKFGSGRAELPAR